MTTLRFFLRPKKPNQAPLVNQAALVQCMAELAPQIEALSDDFDVPHAAEYYGYIISEFVVTNVISPKDLVTKFCPKKVTKETTHNLFMTGVLKELSRLDDPDGPAFVEQHAIVLK